MPRRKRRLASRLRNYVRQLLAFLFSNVGVIVLVVAYTIAGAFMFQAIEGASEIERVNNMARERDNTAQYLWQNVTLKFNPLNETAMKDMCLKAFLDGVLSSSGLGFYYITFSMILLRISIQLLQYQNKVVVAVRRGWDGGRSSRQWSFSSGFLYSLTVITTIGYGHLSPRTSWGKITTIFYALLGMPLFLLYLSNVGELLARWFKCLYALVCLCRGCPGFTRRRVVRIRTQLEVSEPESIERPDDWRPRCSDSDVIPDYRYPPDYRIPPNQIRRPDNRYLIKDRYAPDNRYAPEIFPSDYRIPPNRHTIDRFPPDYRIPPNYRHPLDRFPPDNRIPPYQRHTLERFPPHYRIPQNHRHPLDRFPTDHRIPPNHRRWMSDTIDRFPSDYRIPPNYRNQLDYSHPRERYQSDNRNPSNNRHFQGIRYPQDYRYAPERYPPDFRYPPHPQRHFQRRPDYFRSASMPQPWERPRFRPDPRVRGRSEPAAYRSESQESSDFSYVTFDAQTITVPLSVCVCILVGYIIFGSMLFSMWETWDQLDGAYFCFISLSSIGFGDFVPGERVYTPRIETSFIACSLYLMLGMALVAMCFNLMQEQVIHYVASLKRAVKRLCSYTRCKR